MYVRTYVRMYIRILNVCVHIHTNIPPTPPRRTRLRASARRSRAYEAAPQEQREEARVCSRARASATACRAIPAEEVSVLVYSLTKVTINATIQNGYLRQHVERPRQSHCCGRGPKIVEGAQRTHTSYYRGGERRVERRPAPHARPVQGPKQISSIYNELN